MVELEFPTGWYAEALPDGGWAVLYPGAFPAYVATSNGRVELPDGETGCLYLRCWRSPDGAIDLAGQSWVGRGNIVHRGASWSVLGPSYGVNAVAFWPNGAVELNEVEYGSQGIRWIDSTVHTGDATYGDGVLSEFTDCGDVRVGQGHDFGGIVIRHNDIHHVLVSGDCRFVRANRAGSTVAIAWVHPGGSSARWLDVAEIASLPLMQTASAHPPPPPPPPKKDNPTMPGPTYTGNPTDQLTNLRSQYPTPLGSKHAEFLIAACKLVGHGAGLLAKSGGTVVTLPSGQTVSQDWMVFPDGFGTDFLSDGEGIAKVGWGQLQEYDKTRYVDVSGVLVGGDGPPPPPPPIFDPGAILARLGAIEESLHSVAVILQAFDARIDELEQVKPAETTQYTAIARCGRVFGHNHPITVELTKK